MAFDERKACLWHAFNALGEQGKGVGVKSQLKVLTQNIGTSLGLANAEAGLEDFRSSSAITFRDYIFYLQVELFNRLQNSSVNRQSITKINFDKVDEICWMVCSTRYAMRDGKKLGDDDTYKLWRLFNFLAEEDDSEELFYPVVIDKEEVELFIRKFLQIVSGSLDHTVLTAAIGEACVLSFQEFLTLVESTVCQVLDADTVSLAMSGLHEEFIVQVIKKGNLLKKGHVITNWKERWFVLTPRVLRYFSSRDEKDQKGQICITQYCKAEALPEKVGAKPNRFSLVTEGKTYEVGAPDFRTRTEWISAFKATTDHCTKSETRQRLECRHRAKLRHQRQALLKQEEEKRQVELEQMAKTRLELESEKQARADAEARLQQEAALREAEQERLREVEELRQQLEQLLEAERQAKKDEEIVRSLQSRILEEEFEKREKLEQLKTDLEGLLEEERHKREGLEEERLQHEALLTEEQLKLEQLEQERLNMDVKMEEALAKLREAERVKADLREKMAKKEEQRVFNIKVSKLVHPEPFQFASHRGLGAFSHVILKHVPTHDTADKTSGDMSTHVTTDDTAKASGDVSSVITDTDKMAGDASSSVITDTDKMAGDASSSVTTDTDNRSDDLLRHVTTDTDKTSDDDSSLVTTDTDKIPSVTTDTDKTSSDESSSTTADTDKLSDEVSPVNTKETCAAFNNNTVEENYTSETQLPPGTSCV